MNTVYDILTILPASLLLMLIFGEDAGVPAHSIPAYVLCAAVSVFCIVLYNMKRKTRLCCLGIVTAFAGGLYLAAGKENRQLFLTAYFWVIPVCGFAVLALIVGILSDHNVWLRRAAAAAPLIYCITGTVLEWDIRKEIFALTCLLLLLCTAEEIQRRWVKSGCPDRKAHIARISPFLLAGCLTVYLIPAPDKPYDWQLAKNIWNYTSTLAVRFFGSITHPSEGYAQTGFSDSGGFSAGLGENDEEVLVIHTDNPAIRYYELVGCISGEFTGREWIFDTGQESRSRMLDTMETACAVRKYTSSYRTDYLQDVHLQYETRFYNTQYIFSPAKIQMADTQQKLTGISEQNGSIISKKKLHYKDTYEIACYMLNYGNPQLAELLNHAAPIAEAEWKQVAAAENVEYKSGYSFADYQQYRSGIYKDFCRTYGCSERVREILRQIQQGSSGNYETLKKLESYLSDMAYSTDCGALPEDVTDAGEWLDYFLFTLQKGYCMHYATAFVLMANEMGIPCRYVQGYAVSRDANGDMTVTQSCAHAWAEAYFDHVGWVSFEPTPGYSDQTGWGMHADTSYVFRPDEPTPDSAQDDSDLPEEAAQDSAGIHPLVFMIPSLAAVCFLLLFFILSRSAARRKYAQMNAAEKYRHLAQQNLRLLGYLGFRMEQGETLSDFAQRVLQSGRQDLQAHLRFIPVYETVLYSDQTATDAEVHAAEEIQQALRALVRKQRLRYRLLLLIQGQ